MLARVQYGAIEWDALPRAIGCMALLAVPLAMLIVSPESYSPFASGKTDVFRWLCVAMAGSMLAVLAIKPRAMPGVVWLYGAFAALLALSDFGAANRHDAFWGEPMRQDGFIAIASYLCFFMALTVIPTGERFWAWLIRGWATSGVIVSLASLLQSLNFYLTYQPVPRAYGLMGNPVFFGDYLGLTILFTLWAAKSSRLWLLALIFQIPVLLMTASRSAEFAVLVGCFIMIPGRLKWLLAASGPGFIFLTNSDWHNPISYDMASRVSCWKTHLGAVSQHPWLGFGQENFTLICGTENWDRAHNFIVQALVDGGALGLGAYLAFLAGAFKSVLATPYALAVFVAYLVMMTVEPESLTTIVPMLTALGWANRQYRAGY